jgi:Fur family transcriptional regulator, ferric uptake regulator
MTPDPHTHTGAAVTAADWAEHALGRLGAAGFRQGGARRAVIEVLAAEPCALSALDIDERLRAGERRVGRASVYRALEQLTDLDLVHKLDLGAEPARYERTDPGGEHHHHMICDECGKVLPFEDAAVERAVTSVTGSAGFEVRDHEIVLHGACDACR